MSTETLKRELDYLKARIEQIERYLRRLSRMGEHSVRVEFRPNLRSRR